MSIDAQVARLQEDESSVEHQLLFLIDEASQRTMDGASTALDATEMVTALADRLDSPLPRARARRARARALAYVGRYPEALNTCDEAVYIAESSGYPIEAGRARLASMHALNELGRLDDSIMAGRQALRIFEEGEEPSLAGRADINLGIAYQKRDDPKQALACFSRARPLLRDEPLVLGHIDNNRGEALLSMNDFSGAMAAFQSALEEYQDAQAHIPAAIAQGNLADLAARQGHLQGAMSAFEMARRQLERIESPVHLARLVSEQAEAKAVLGLPVDALRDYQRALGEMDRCGLALEAARARSGMGMVLLRLGRFAEAETALAAAATAFDDLNNATARAKVDLTRAELAGENGRFDEACRLSLRSLSVLRSRPADAAVARYLHARMCFQMGDLEQAQADLNASIAIASQYELAPLMADLLHWRSKLHLRRSCFDDAVDDLQSAVTQVERIRGTLQADRFRAAFIGDRSVLYEDLVEALLDRNDPDSVSESFTVVEQARSRGLLDQMGAVVDLESIRPEESGGDDTSRLHGELSRVRSELNALYSRLADEQVATGGTHALEVWRKSVHRLETELSDIENRLSTTRGAAGLYARPSTLGDIQKDIEPGALLLEYFIVGDEVLAYVIGGDEARVVRGLMTKSDLQAGLRDLQFQMRRALRPGAERGRRSERLLDDMRRVLGRLESSLLQPIRNDLDEVGQITIIPHGPLHLLPFHALENESSTLIDTHRVHYAPSASILSQLGRISGGHSGSQRSLVVGVSDEAAPEIARETQLIADLLQSRSTEVLMEEEACVDRVCALAPRASVLHFACHGRFSSENPLGSGLRLADRWLTVRDLYGMRLETELVTLSGCETGLTRIEKGDRLTGLLHGFFAAGAPSVLVSLWQAHDESTAQFMEAFYTTRFGERNRARSIEAVQEAQIQVKSERPHPAYWAPFVLVGNP